MKKAVMQASICGLIASTHLFSNPTGPLITSGDVSVDFVDAHHLHVDSRSERSIITWDSFSIDAAESAYFHLPDSSSAVLNKVSSNLPSTLAGLLESNGHVYLLNPNGVLVTKEGVINTASFLASTLDVNNDFFLRGEDLLFAGTSQESVINQGKITSWQGDVVLLGLVVRNEGEINAVNGVAALGAGTEILLTPHADYRIAIQVPVADLGHGDVGIAQEGIITALQTELKTSGNAYALAIHNSGRINATSFEKTAGRVYLIADKGLVSHTGTITAIGTDTVGGDVQILGERVALTEGAIVDVSGDFGGGSLLVGGDYRGANPAINNAMHTFVEDGVTLTADALQSGNGGQVIVWGVESARFFGFASAQGGPFTGSGGFIEVSSVNSLQYNGLANTLAKNGSSGTLLLDPTDVDIITAGAGLVLNGVSCFADTYCGGCTGLAAAGIDPVVILAQLLLTDVIIDASSGAGAGAGSITITTGFDTTGTANDLTLIALTDVDINDDVTIGGTGNFFIYAGSNNDGTQIGTGGIANLGTIGGVITLAAGTTLETTSSGNITLVTSFTSNLDGIVIDGTLNSSGSGGVFMQTYFGGNIHFSATGLLTSSGSSQFSFSSINDILFDGAAPITFSAGSGTLQLVAGDSAQCGTGVIDIAGTVLFDTGTTGGLSFNSNAGVTLNTVNYDSTAASTIFSSFSVDLNGPVNVGTTTVNEFLVQSGVVITVNDAISVNTTAPVIGAGNYTLRLLSSQVITVDADVNVVDEASLRLTAQVISFNGAHTSTFNTNGAVDIFSASGSATTNIGDGVNAYNFVHQSLGTVTFNGSNVLMNSPSTITANILGSQLQFTTRLSALSGTTITFDPGCDGINMTKGCSLSGVFDYHTAGAFTATTTANPLATGTTGVLTFDGAGTVSFIATGGSIQFNNQGVNSFAVSNSTTLVVTQTTGSILMGTMARIDYTSSPNLSILTTTGSIDFDGTSLINFNPSMAGAFLSITSTDGNVNVGSITYGAGTGTCTISSTNGSVGQNSGGLLDWSSATAGGLVFSGGSGVSINGDINYTTTNPFSMTTTVAGVIFQDSASTITVNAGASGLALNATNTAGSNAIDIAGDINYSSANDFDFNVASGNVALESTANLSMLAGSGSLNIGTTGTPLPGTIISTGLITYSSGAVGESLSMVAVEQITAGNISITDGSTNLIRSTTNDIITDALTTISASSGNLTMDAPLGQITTNGALTFSGGTLTLTCQDDININNTTMITGASELIATTSAGDLYLNSVLTVNSSLAVGTQLTAALGGIGINGAGVTFTGGAFVLSCQNDIDINSTSSFTGNSRFSMTSTTANVSLNNSLSVDSTNATASQFISTLGNVNINNSITYSGALNVNPLTITAQNDIGMNNTFSYLSSGDCTLTATTGILGFNVVTFPAGGTGGLTGSADLAVFINGPMVFDSSGNYSLTAITGPLLINATFDLATTGQLDLHAGQDLFIINALTNTLAGDMFFSGGTIFRIEPVLFGVQGSISSAGGDITIGGIAGTTGMVRLQGSSNPGFINSNGGAISITSTGDAFLIDNVSIDSGAGSYNLSIGGALNLLAAANTIITGTSGVVAVTDNLLILADSGGSSQITAAGNVTITSGDSIYLIGFPATAQTASINSSAAGNVSVSTTGGAGTLEIRDSSNITTTGVGTITLAAVGHVIIDNDSRVQTTGTGLITIGTVGTRIGGNITVSGGITGPSSITATTGGISIFTTNSILMGGVSAVNRATITASGGIYTLNAGKSIIMNPFATASLTAGAGALTLAAAQEIIMAGNTLLTNSGTGTSTITMADGTFMSGLEGVTTITTGTGALSMTASNKIFMSSMESNIFTVTTGGNATLTSTRNIIALVGAPSAVTEIITTGVLSLSASQNIDILNNVSLSSTGNMNLTTTNGDLAIQNIASISAGALFTGTIGGDVAMKSS
ncbi:MAG: filamentous hemagglutinin N-terminal domain-containing protein, partial [Chlamydiota bacterium]